MLCGPRSDWHWLDGDATVSAVVSLENFGPRARGGPILHYVTGIGSNRAMGVCTGAVQIYICVCM
jgi:hypothetical protein